jgi:hypothetical protein
MYAVQEQAKAAAEQQQRLDRGEEDGDEGAEVVPVAAPAATEVPEEGVEGVEGVEGETEGAEEQPTDDHATDDAEALRKSAAAKRKKGSNTGKDAKPAGDGVAAMETDDAAAAAAGADAWMAQVGTRPASCVKRLAVAQAHTHGSSVTCAQLDGLAGCEALLSVAGRVDVLRSEDQHQRVWSCLRGSW